MFKVGDRVKGTQGIEIAGVVRNVQEMSFGQVIQVETHLGEKDSWYAGLFELVTPAPVAPSDKTADTQFTAWYKSNVIGGAGISSIISLIIDLCRRAYLAGFESANARCQSSEAQRMKENLEHSDEKLAEIAVI